MVNENSGVDIFVYGVLINIWEVFGVFYFKGFIIDDCVFYSGVSLNDVYLYQYDKYCYDCYQCICNGKMVDIMFDWVDNNLVQGCGVNCFDRLDWLRSLEIKNDICQYCQEFCDCSYYFVGIVGDEEFFVILLVGLGKLSLLNKIIFYLMFCVEYKLMICIFYFNFFVVLVRNIIQLLCDGKQVEIIVGDKMVNDFYIFEDQLFKIIGVFFYLYEINLWCFFSWLQYYVNIDQLIVCLWKDDDNSYYLKGMWVDDEWMLFIGNNLNLCVWWFDLENVILIYDLKWQLGVMWEKELKFICIYIMVVKYYWDL